MNSEDDYFDDFDDLDDTFYDGLSELEKSEKYLYVVRMAFNNSYDIITNKINFSELLDITQNSKEGYTALAHDVDEEVSIMEIKKMIFYFEEVEEYEKCAVLHKMFME